MALKYHLLMQKSVNDKIGDENQQENLKNIQRDEAEIHKYFGLNCIKIGKLDKARINLEYALDYYDKHEITFDNYNTTI